MANRRRVPGYLLHKPRGTGKVIIHGKTIYLPGKYGSDESKAEYDRLIAEYLTKQDRPAAFNVTINRLCVAYLQFAETFYRKHGEITEEVNAIRRALRPLVSMYGSSPVADFGSLKLKEVRKRMVALGWYRRTVNDQVSRIVRMLSWGCEEEWVPTDVVNKCREVRNLQAGRCGNVPEGDAVEPVDIERIEAIKSFVNRHIWGMIQLQLATAMRPQEVRVMRWCDIDRSDSEVWCYQPSRHKMEHKKRTRKIFIGPAGQRILNEFLKADQTAFIFSPIDAQAERREMLRENRKSPMTPSQATRKRVGNPLVTAGNMYTKDSYRRAVTRACEKAFQMPEELRSIPASLSKLDRDKLIARATAWRQEWCWAPNRLRHTAGTLLRKQVDLNAARQVLGHSEKRTTEVYAEQDFDAAKEIMRRLG